MIACAQTGTGKTAAYLLPIMHKLETSERSGGLNTIIIAPTRELALQIDQQIVGLSYFTSISSIAVYGGGTGAEFDREKIALKTGTDIIVATPGKLIAHLNMGYVDTKHIRHLILDEADRMLDMGFFEDIMRIVGHMPQQRQTLMFSATMPPKIRQLASRLLKDPAEVNIAISKTAAGVHQSAYSVWDEQKENLLAKILDRPGLDSVIVFSSRKTTVRSIEKALQRKRINAKSISSDLEQREREEVLRQFRNRSFPVLVATDVMSRGIDIADLDMVINFDVPYDAEDYVHRVGRTARAKATGEAITFVTPKEQRNFYKIEKLTGVEVEKPAVPEEFGKAPDWQDAEQLRRRGGDEGGNRRGGRPAGNHQRRSSGGERRGGSGGGGGRRHSGGGNRRRNDRPRREGPSGAAPSGPSKGND
ncbi:DEAD/DEAH box helicase [Cesiribacter andamanensis]|uniref:Cold-shock DEAD box protein A n=1 Tax=Cesiribacter andamanensis AMV16 TaxID=1279009 RepID=M7N7P3_9BACT|nr:DEAD/DEAH box helicase [Cesiribacter andamanensis]EMR04633.1 Cold-shock DEAD box protein A [Cesiribacter andamanensis AMV16]